MTQVAAGQIITITRAAVDPYGNPGGEPSTWTIPDAVFWEQEISTDTTRRVTSIVIGYVSVPQGSDVAQNDQITLADGSQYLAIGRPQWGSPNPLSGFNNGRMAVKVKGVF